MLLGRQREMAALKVVGSGVDASAVGTGKTISSGRALAHRATTQPRFRGLVVAEGRLLGQWREELTRGAPGRGLPPLAPNVELLVVSDDRQIAGQIRRFDRELGDRPGVALAAISVLDRNPADLQAIPWHLLIADEALRYANPATGHGPAGVGTRRARRTRSPAPRPRRRRASGRSRPAVAAGPEHRGVLKVVAPGAARGHVQTYIPYIRRGGIEHVVSVLAARGAEHHQILDSFEGVRADESTVATQLGEITGQVADSKDDAGYAATAARLRVAASVFGS